MINMKNEVKKPEDVAQNVVPEESIQKFISVLKSTVSKIEDNQAEVLDYQNFEAMMAAIGLPLEMIESLLSKNRFDNWEEYSKNRKQANSSKSNEVSIVLGGILGMSSGAIEVLENVLKKSNKSQEANMEHA